jgi:hypothetical protein
MKRFYKTGDGLETQERLYWEFIKAIDKVNEYQLWHKAVVKKEFQVKE